MEFTKPERIALKSHPELNEKWVQDLIANDPAIIGLGELVFRQSERAQPRGGRLDLLLQDPDTKRRYEIEIQLGATDESHIIRTIEYWDIERKRYPQYEHCAVLIAEDITSRFLNVISLFNGSVPLIAIQMQALKVGNHTTLVFTKVVDELVRGNVEEDEDAEAAPADRPYWEKRSTKATMHLADEIFGIVREIDPSLEMKFNKFYIGLTKDGQPFNFVVVRPLKSSVTLKIRLERSDETDAKIDAAGIETLEFSSRYGGYRLALKKADVDKNRELLKDLMQQAYKLRID
jgi:predicted transport protein